MTNSLAPALAPSASTSAAGQPDPAADAAAAHARPTFDVLPLSAELRRGVDEAGYQHPSPVQIAVWEPASRGRDAVVQARTGTGKTAAFALPILDVCVRKNTQAAQVLALTPTRELALQVSREIEKLGKYKSVSTVAIYGGAAMGPQIDALAAGTQIIVGTPGRVLDHLRRGTLDAKSLRLLVLDECDEMLSMGFERELSAILEFLPKERQTLLFSATLPPDIERMAARRLRDPEFVTLSGDHVGALSIAHFAYMVASDKVGTLVRVLEVENPESAVVFCNTKDQTEVVAQALKRQGFSADWLNGDLPQNDRERVMTATREGRLRFLVATDVAARGIDISHLTHVINYDFPQDAEAYVHRTGRTGRAGRTGTAISLVTPRDIGSFYLMRLTYKIRPIEKRIPSEGELKTRAETDLIEMLVQAFGATPAHPEDLALARRLLTHDLAESVVAGLLRDHLGARPGAADEASARRRVEPPAAAQRARAAAPPAPPAQPAQAAPVAHAAPAQPPQAQQVSAPAAPAGPAADARSEREPRRDDRQPRDDRGDRGPRGRGRDRDDRNSREARRPNDRPVEPVSWGNAPPAPREGDERQGGFRGWAPPDEEGDDEPILGDRAGGAGRDAREPQDTRDAADVFVSVGRRDGVRASELQGALDEAGIPRDAVLRIRVRDRNTFVTVARAEVARVAAGLHGITLGGRVVTAEPARGDRGPGDGE